MHEHSFIQAIISQVPNKENVKEITLELGELAGIERAHLKEHLQEETQWDVEIINKESSVKCSCGYKGRAKILERLHDLVLFSCPKCNKLPQVIYGKDIKILKIIYKD
ncbi:MAG: hydrogenase/urease maturation nickel metallochaperone HypA [Candidatus Nanoarchaeia archaeon]